MLNPKLMDARFWEEKWEKNEIGFHQAEVNPSLIKHFRELALEPGARVFVPLCGKTLDIGWLLARGYRVAGAELSGIAIEQLFAGLGVKPQVAKANGLEHYRAPNLDIFGGDIFNLSREMLGGTGGVDAVYDRAALVALPPEVRRRYTAHLMEMTEGARQLLLCFEYDQRLMNGPPFSIGDEEVRGHYARSFEVRLLESHEIPGGFRGISPVTEKVWLLK